MHTPASKKLTFKCVSCKRTLTVPDTASGKVVACPCGKKLKVPNTVSAAPVSSFDIDLPASPAFFSRPSSPYQSPSAVPLQNVSSPSSDVYTVKSGQRFLIFSIIGYFCSAPLLVLANVFLAGTPEKPIVTPAFGLLLGLGLLCMFAAVCCASFGIFRMGKVLFPGSTRFVYAAGVFVPAPIVGLLVMFVANSTATGYLRAKGVTVGFFGAKG